MKFGFRLPSFSKRLAARTSWKRIVRHSMGFKAPKGYGIFTNPKKAIYNKIYRKTTVGAEQILSKGNRSTVKKVEKVRRTSNDPEIFGNSNNAVKDHISQMAKDYEDVL